MYSIYWYKKQTKNLCTSESVCCLQHALIFEFFRHAGMRQMVTQYQEYYILSYTLTNWPSIAVIWINMHAWKITHDVHLFSLWPLNKFGWVILNKLKFLKIFFQRYICQFQNLKMAFKICSLKLLNPCMYIFFSAEWFLYTLAYSRHTILMQHFNEYVY